MRKQTTKALLVCALISILIIPQLGCGSNLNNPFASNNTYEGIGKTGFYLDTVCKITVYSMKDEDGHLASLSEEELKKEVDILITEAFKLCTQYENLFSKTIDTSEIAKINTAKGKPVEVSEETVAVIDKGIEYGNLSEGAFDITIGKATDLWNFREADEVTHEGGDIPSEKTLKEAVSHVNYKKIKIKDNSVTLEDPEMEIDLGGIAKGYIADRVADFLQGKGVTSAVISLGGNIEVIGGKPKDFFDEERGDFSIGITDPLSETGQLLAVIP